MIGKVKLKLMATAQKATMQNIFTHRLVFNIVLHERHSNCLNGLINTNSENFIAFSLQYGQYTSNPLNINKVGMFSGNHDIIRWLKNTDFAKGNSDNYIREHL